MSLLHLKSLCVVTGASKGIGRSIALHLAKNIGLNSVIVLLARNTTALENVKTELTKMPEFTELKLKVVVRHFDQGSQNVEDFQTLYPNILQELQLTPEDFELVMMVHNAGSLEYLKYVKNLEDMAKVGNFFHVNLVGMIALNTQFLQTFSEQKKCVVNLSSLAAIQPMKSWALYCSVKAARDMFFKTLATEEPNVRVLNYAPGPIKTDMMTAVFEDTEDLELRNVFTEMKENDKFLTCEMTVPKLMKVLDLNTFENGQHIDYYDVE